MQGQGGSEVHDLKIPCSSSQFWELELNSVPIFNFSELSLTGTELDELKLWDKELRDRIFDLSGELPRPWYRVSHQLMDLGWVLG